MMMTQILLFGTSTNFVPFGNHVCRYVMYVLTYINYSYYVSWLLLCIFGVLLILCINSCHMCSWARRWAGSKEKLQRSKDQHHTVRARCSLTWLLMAAAVDNLPPPTNETAGSPLTCCIVCSIPGWLAAAEEGGSLWNWVSVFWQLQYFASIVWAFQQFCEVFWCL